MMSKQEIYAWCSLGFTSAVFAYYLVSAFGWPAAIENYSDHLTSLIWQVIIITVLVEICLDLLNSKNIGGIQKDERDKIIEYKGFRNAYYFVMATLVTLIGHIVLGDFMSGLMKEDFVMAVPSTALHLLVILLFTANLIKSTTQLYYYRSMV